MNKGKSTSTSGMDWNSMLGLTQRLKQDKHYRDYLLILSGCYLGLRISDLLSLQWKDLIDKDELILIEKKTGKQRRLTINPKLQDAVLFCFTKDDSLSVDKTQNIIFSNRWGSKLSISYVNRRLKQIFRLYNVTVKNCSSHTLRKTFGKRVYEHNNKSESSLIFLSEIFSHSSISITRKYIGITSEQIADIYLAL